MIQGLKRQAVSKLSKLSGLKLRGEHSVYGVEKCLEDCTIFNQVKKNKIDKVFKLHTKACKALFSTEFNLEESASDVTGISYEKDAISFHFPHEILAEAVLVDIITDKGNYGRKQASEANLYFDGKRLIKIPRREKVVVEYSSPNIAKPFHAGHLRSTVIGRFIVNISKLFDQNVTSINYLGDWGTQFGYMAVGFEKYGALDSLNQNPIQHLFDVYKKINKDAETDPAVHSRAMEFFKSLERGDETAKEFWQKCRTISIEEYDTMYKRLGINFDIITGESEYSEQGRNLVSLLKESNQVQANESGVLCMNITEEGDKVPVVANLLKSDGSTLYLTRDIAAALDRFSSLSADKLFYVVENGQQLHFKQLKRILQRLHSAPEAVRRGLVHVKFGRVEKMSTRRGEAVLLRDILDEARSIMEERMLDKLTTKVSGPEFDVVAEKLATCGIVIQDLKQSRLNNYAFSWEDALNFNGDSGVFLQYTHARLCSLIENSDDIKSTEINFKLLSEEAAANMVLHLARFPEVLIRSYMSLEAYNLVQYLFILGRLVNIAHSQLQVKNQPIDIASSRLALFKCTRQVLVNGLNILGIEPLSKI